MESINTRKRVLVSLCPLDTYTHRPWLVIQKSRSSSISHLKKMMIPDVGWTLWGFGWLIALWRPSPFVFGRRRWCLFLFVCQAFFFYLSLWNKRHRLQQPTLKGAVLLFGQRNFAFMPPVVWKKEKENKQVFRYYRLQSREQLTFSSHPKTL